MGKQLQALKSQPRILIGTPGRLIDHMQQKTINLHDVHVLVLDEADRMLDMGFGHNPTAAKASSSGRQTLLFSATMPDTIMNIAKSYMKLPVRVEVAPTAPWRIRSPMNYLLYAKN